MWILVGVSLFVMLALFFAGYALAAWYTLREWRSLSSRQKSGIAITLFGFFVFLCGTVNFAVFATVSVAIGGDAVAGKIENGRYYVSSHGRLTEVSRDVWHYSYRHARITWATSLVATLGLAVSILSQYIFGIKHKPLTITLCRDGTYLIDGKSVPLAEVLAQAEKCRSASVPIYIQQDYPRDAPPGSAIALYQELAAREILVQTIQPKSQS
jgi:hypothetical protein